MKLFGAMEVGDRGISYRIDWLTPDQFTPTKCSSLLKNSINVIAVTQLRPQKGSF
jgi:hypothetical protein